MSHSFFRTANHHAVTSFQAPDATTRPDVDIIDSFFAERPSAARVIFEIRVAAVDDDVLWINLRREIADRLFRGIARRDHDPDCSRLPQFANEILE